MALDVVNLIKKKGDEEIKGRIRVNDAKQRKFVTDEVNFTSPKLVLEALITFMVIDEYEDRDVFVTYSKNNIWSES